MRIHTGTRFLENYSSLLYKVHPNPSILTIHESSTDDCTNTRSEHNRTSSPPHDYNPYRPTQRYTHIAHLLVGTQYLLTCNAVLDAYLNKRTQCTNVPSLSPSDDDRFLGLRWTTWFNGVPKCAPSRDCRFWASVAATTPSSRGL